ncbi:helix-turn-helix domain-containing protein [Elizabethkingia anophelis]|uniref:helix-turn-helix domain-containing protein n=2 Tax=Elizabethkingia anophelis TaxID=1117645 RepID=UPI00346304CC
MTTRMLIKKYLLLLLILFLKPLYSQKETYSEYYKIKEKYINREENDFRAFNFLNQYISKAKSEKNYIQLTQAYKDAVFYSSSREQKLSYADSTILAAKRTSDKDLISDAYLGKGIIYYFNYKKYKLALDEYLKAYQYSENTHDNYLKYRVIYHLGVVKSYLGYYQEALAHFKEALAYFESQIKTSNHPNIIFNNQKGYYHSIHQMIFCYRNLGDYPKAESLIKLGLAQTYKTNFKQERGYFLKENGIDLYRRKKYAQAILSLNESVPNIKHFQDFAWTAVDYFYIGKSYLAEKKSQMAINNFKKVDSVFQKHSFILPELRENYEILINYYKKKKDPSKELYYTKQLLKADSIISKDFTYLSSKIHREYDTQSLIKDKQRLEKKTSLGTILLISVVILVILLCTILISKYKKEKDIRNQYKMFELKKIYEQQQKTLSPSVPKSNLDAKMVEELLQKLKSFEEKNEYTEQGLTLNKLAQKLGTNSNYLSQIINDYKGTNFNRYLSELRINFITEKLYNDKIFLNYKIETLAEKCGIASRSNFSNLFHEINGIRPADFIKQHKIKPENHK